MIRLLDSDTRIRFLNGRSVAIRERLGRIPIETLAVCSIVKAELRFGAHRSRDPAKSILVQDQFLGQFQSFPFDDQAAFEAGRIRAVLATQGRSIGPNDLLIAAIALANDLTLITHNVREYGRVEGLSVEDWEEAES